MGIEDYYELKTGRLKHIAFVSWKHFPAHIIADVDK